MTDAKAYRPDGGDISEGRLREIADNPYGDEEKSWLAKKIASEEGKTKEPYRILDRRLQALRKAGVIRSTPKGWVKV